MPRGCASTKSTSYWRVTCATSAPPRAKSPTGCARSSTLECWYCWPIPVERTRRATDSRRWSATKCRPRASWRAATCCTRWSGGSIPYRADEKTVVLRDRVFRQSAKLTTMTNAADTMPAAQMVADAKTRTQNLTPDQLAAEIETGQPLLVDLREPEECAQNGTIPGAVQ